jgi:hypothetical protein
LTEVILQCAGFRLPAIIEITTDLAIKMIKVRKPWTGLELATRAI